MAERAIILCAVSRPEQATLDKVSMRQQEIDGRAVCEQHSWHVADVLRLPGYSRNFFTIADLAEYARNKKNNVPDRLMEHIRRRDFDILVARQGDRVGRTQTLITEVIERTIRQARAKVFLVETGMIDAVNFRGMAAITGFQAASNNDNLVRRRRETMTDYAAKGIPTSSGVLFPYIEVRNEEHVRTGIRIDERHRPLLRHVADLVLEGIGWRLLEQELYERYGYARDNGRPYPRAFFFKRIFHPIWWGHSARFFRGEEYANGQRVDTWVYDLDAPLPPDVVLFPNTHEPVWTGELAERVKSELARRRLVARGSARTEKTKRFAGLCVCGNCGRYMKCIHKGNWDAVACHSRFFTPVDQDICPPSPSVSYARLQDYLHRRLQRMLDLQNPASFLDIAPQTDDADELKRAQKDLETIIASARKLVQKQMTLPDELSDIYDEELSALAERRSKVERYLDELKRQRSSHDAVRQRVGYDRVRQVGLDNFWQQDDRTINQILHDLFAGYSLVIAQGHISHDAPAPPHRHHK